jgi:hypothetical protein
MICALTHDDPADDCSDRGGARILVSLLAVAVVLSVATIMLLRVRRRRAERLSRGS